MKKLFMVFLIGMSAIGYANTEKKEFKNIKKLEDEMEKCFMRNEINSFEYKTFNMDFKNRNSEEINKK